MAIFCTTTLSTTRLKGINCYNRSWMTTGSARSAHKATSPNTWSCTSISKHLSSVTPSTTDNFSICWQQKTFQPFIIFQSYSNKNLYQQWIHQVQTSKLILNLILHSIQQHQVHRCNYPHKQNPAYPFCLIVCQLILVLGLFRQEHLLFFFLPLLLNPHSLLLFSLPLLLFLLLL
jgi:hypothetical protein